jgi:hypothetical protein
MYAKVNQDKKTVITYPYTYQSFKKDHPSVSLPMKKFEDPQYMKEKYGLIVVVKEEPPYYDQETHYVTWSNIPEYLNGRYVLAVAVREIRPPIEGTMEHDSIKREVDRTRIIELSKTDWTQLPDVSEEIQLKWREFRQQLRDIPSQVGYPLDIKWPVRPE